MTGPAGVTDDHRADRRAEFVALRRTGGARCRPGASSTWPPPTRSRCCSGSSTSWAGPAYTRNQPFERMRRDVQAGPIMQMGNLAARRLVGADALGVAVAAGRGPRG
jgi:alkylation response protein AidB-like acyl-CoA dehydrogenase